MASMSLSTLWATAPATATVFFGIQANAADSGLSPTASSAWLTAWRSDGAVVTMKLSSSFTKSSAPASSAFSIAGSSSHFPTGTMICPFRSNMNATEFVAPKLPPRRDSLARTSATVRVGLSVSAAIMMATPPGP